jgi:hypothetical protein
MYMAIQADRANSNGAYEQMLQNGSYIEYQNKELEGLDATGCD